MFWRCRVKRSQVASEMFSESQHIVDWEYNFMETLKLVVQQSLFMCYVFPWPNYIQHRT